MAEEKKGTKVAVVYYSMYGHIRKMAEHVAKGAESTGAEVKIFQVCFGFVCVCCGLFSLSSSSNHLTISPSNHRFGHKHRLQKLSLMKS